MGLVRAASITSIASLEGLSAVVVEGFVEGGLGTFFILSAFICSVVSIMIKSNRRNSALTKQGDVVPEEVEYLLIKITWGHHLIFQDKSIFYKRSKPSILLQKAEIYQQQPQSFILWHGLLW